ncbi:ubiquitin-conjugating enzyme E2 J2, partial [Blastocladiella britannica]
MATLTAHKRLAKEYRDVTRSPPPFVVAKPLDNNILEWHYLLLGPPDSPYTGGIYWGKVVFPADYPYKPPAIRMLTPSGRFKPGERICLSYSDFHPESWNPGWSVATILTGLVSFMTSNDRGAGSVSASTEERAELASAAWEWNRRQRGFVDVWPEFLGP